MNKSGNSLAKEARLFGNLQVLVITSLLVALSVVFGKLLAVNITQSFRISFENLPVLLAGIAFGPWIGAMTGMAADLIGCLVVGFAVNPIITFGAACVGLVSGAVSHFILVKRNQRSILLSVAAAHLIGSILVKSIGIYLWYGTPLSALWLRVPIYLVTGTAEAYLILLLFQSRAINRYIEGVYRV